MIKGAPTFLDFAEPNAIKCDWPSEPSYDVVSVNYFGLWPSNKGKKRRQVASCKFKNTSSNDRTD